MTHTEKKFTKTRTINNPKWLGHFSVFFSPFSDSPFLSHFGHVENASNRTRGSFNGSCRLMLRIENIPEIPHIDKDKKIKGA